MTGFGANTSYPSFGFGSNTQSPFGQTQRFGTPTSSTFGNPTPAFGQSTTSMFGAPQQSAPLFGTPASTAPAFGTNTQNVFGSNTLFGQQSQPQPTTSLFGASGSTFGQQQKTTAFNFPSTQSTGLFGQTTAQQPQQQNMFQPSASSNMFGSSGFGTSQVQTGTCVKFIPVTGTDTMQKSGNSSMINTKHHSITFMKEYDAKSFEELRFEDYSANRKGPQQTPGFGASSSAFGAPAPAFGTAVSSAPSIFGQPENKSVFGAQNTSFGQAPFGMGSQTSATQNVFGKPATPFGAAVTSTNTFGFGNTPSTNMFASTQPAKPFGTQPTAPLFNQPSTGFGTGTLFGQPVATQQSSFFNKPAQPAFSTPQTGAFGFGQTPALAQTNSLFQTTKPSFNLFGQNTATTANTFGQPQQTGFTGFNSFAKPAQPTFGQPTQNTGFGTGTALQTNNLFGAIGTKPAFGTNNTGSGLFTGTTMQQPNNAFSFQTQPANQPMGLTATNGSLELQTMFDMTDPYGFSPHLDGLNSIKKFDTHYATNPKDIETVLHIQDQQATAGHQRSLRICPPVTAKNKWYLFESNFEKTDHDSLSITVKPSAKRLNLKGGPSKKPDPVIVYQNGKIIGENSNLHSDYSVENPFKTNTNNDLQKDNVETEVVTVSTQSKEKKAVKFTEKAQVIVEERKIVEKSDEVSSSEIRTEKQRSLSTEGIDKCGIICTRPEYYTIPSIEELSKFRNEDGTCVIKGFTIGRVGYGNVYFPEAMDVSNLNIDELVHFRYREICIYTDDETKPPVGEGLNRKAQVTLDRVFPKKESNRQLLETDPQELMTNHFADSLKSVCLKSNTTFLDYRPETGSWVFNVPHFSKYGLVDSEDESDEKMVEDHPLNEIKEKKRIYEKRKRVEQTSISEEQAKKGLGGTSFSEVHLDGISFSEKRLETGNCDNSGSKQMDYEQENDISPFGKNIAVTNMPYNYTITSVTDPIVEMNIQNLQNPSMQEVANRTKSLRDYKELFYEDDMCYQPPSKKMAECLINSEHKPDVLIDKKVKPKINRYKLQNILVTVSLQKSLLTSRAIMDMAVFKGRSFRVGWGRGFTMTAIATETNINPTCVLLLDGSRLQKSIPAETRDSDPFMHNISDFMEVVRKTTIFSQQKDENGLECIPYCVEMKGIKMLRELTELANVLAEMNEENVKMRYYANIWNLCMAFWDDSGNENYMDRRALFNNWLENVTRPFVDKDLVTKRSMDDNENYRRMLINLSGHKITKAVELCLKFNSPQLALLFSQFSTTTFGRQCMQYQLSLWDTTFTSKHIDTELLKLYLVTSGTPFYQNINVCENFDWVRSLGMYYWYFSPSWKSVGYALDYYEKAVDEGLVENPYPIHRKQSTDTWDILFHIMKLFKNEKLDLDNLLSPLTHTDNRCDFRLSWFIHKAFLALSIGVLSEKTKVELTTVFSAQLEQLGLFKWAIFVLLYLDDIKMRKQLVCAVLDRNITDEPNLIEKELVCDIKIPKEWIHMVKAYQTHQLENYWEAYKHLACSQMWYECSDVVLRRLAPQLVANDNFPLLKKILLPLSTRNNNHKVAVIMEFIKIWEIFHGDEVNIVSTSEVFKDISKLVLLLKHYQINNVDQCMIISEISKYCFKFLLSLLKKTIDIFDNLNFEYIIEQLVMPFDYRYVQSNKLISFTKVKYL